MAGTVVDRTPLGASTTNRKWYLDVRTPATPAAPAGPWTGVFGIGELKPNPATGNEVDDSDFDGGGYKSSTVTSLTHGAEGKVHRKVRGSDPTAYDPGQELIRLNSYRMGAGNRLEYRLYEMEPDGPRVEAYQGFASTTWSPDGGNMEATDIAGFALKGQGRLVPIAHPEGVTAAPITYSASPSGAAAGSSVVIQGVRFSGITGATGVKFGAVNATSYQVLNDATILAVVPAGAAGSAPITVGTATPLPYTRGA